MTLLYYLYTIQKASWPGALSRTVWALCMLMLPEWTVLSGQLAKGYKNDKYKWIEVFLAGATLLDHPLWQVTSLSMWVGWQDTENTQTDVPTDNVQILVWPVGRTFARQWLLTPMTITYVAKNWTAIGHFSTRGPSCKQAFLRYDLKDAAGVLENKTPGTFHS